MAHREFTAGCLFWKLYYKCEHSQVARSSRTRVLVHWGRDSGGSRDHQAVWLKPEVPAFHSICLKKKLNNYDRSRG